MTSGPGHVPSEKLQKDSFDHCCALRMSSPPVKESSFSTTNHEFSSRTSRSNSQYMGVSIGVPLVLIHFKRIFPYYCGTPTAWKAPYQWPFQEPIDWRYLPYM